MLKNKAINIGVIKHIARQLGELCNELVFVGGAVVSLYADDPAAEDVRPTKDIDFAVKITSYSEMNNFSERLALKNIFPSADATITYRYHYKDITLDFIPTDYSGLGPTSNWLKKGFDRKQTYNLEEITIFILPVTYYIAAKYEAYASRGGNDKRTSHDFEDIVHVLDNNTGLVKTVSESDEEIKSHLIAVCSELLADPFIEEAIECHINPYTASERLQLILDKVKAISNLKAGI